jgi:hypothetical protein
VHWKYIALLGAAAILLPSARARADCAGHPEWEAELPHEVDTPKGNHISYRYDWSSGSYFVSVSRGGRVAAPRGPYPLTTGGCFPARLEWESEQFAVLNYGCGSFCWVGLAFRVPSDREPVLLSRPYAFDPELNLVASYPEPDVITVTNVATGREQSVRTPAHCPSVSGTCFDDKLELAAGRLRYVWKYWLPLPDNQFKYFPDEQIDVELDADVSRSP